jgi:hypothetical protein
VRGGMEHLREIKPRCHGGDGLQPTGARRWKLLELVAEQFAATRPFFLIPFITTCFSHSNKSSPNAKSRFLVPFNSEERKVHQRVKDIDAQLQCQRRRCSLSSL